jgi:ribosomal protein S18 acetylase RimI-like enzyme
VSDAFAQADVNLLASLRLPARWQGAPAEAHDAGGLTLVAGVRRYPVGYANCAARRDGTVAAGEALARAAAFFAARDRGFSFYLRDPVDGDLVQATAAAGLAPVATMPWMVLDEPPPAVPLPPGVRMRMAGVDAGVAADAAALCADAYESLGLPGAVTASLFGDAARTDPGVGLVVADLDGVPAATAMLLRTGDVAGVYWVATARGQRGRGLGEACTRAVVEAGFAGGARFAALQASPMGAPIYARIGFVTRWQCRWVLVTREQARALAG